MQVNLRADPAAHAAGRRCVSSGSTTGRRIEAAAAGARGPCGCGLIAVDARCRRKDRTVRARA